MARDEDRDRALGRAVHQIRARQTHPDGSRWTQKDLAAAMDLSETSGAITVSRIENGAVKITTQRLERLAEALQVSVNDIEKLADKHYLHEIDKRGLSAARAAEAGLGGGVGRIMRKAMGGDQAAENHQRRLALEAQVADRQASTVKYFDRLSEAQQFTIGDFLEPLIEQGQRVQREVPLGPAPDSPTEGLSLEQRLELHNSSLTYQVTNTLGTTALGAGLGAAAGGGAAALAMTLVATSATASTGIAIGSLTGAAATSATLAWLGGGSLAAGGLGVAGGALVLASIVTLPALIAAGGVLTYQGRKMRREAVSEAERLDQAWSSLHDTDDALQRVWAWMRREQRVLDDLSNAGRKRLRVLRRDLDAADTPFILERADDTFTQNFQSLTEIAVTCVSVLGLPILADLNPDPADDDDPVERREWIDLVLADAESQMKLHRGTRRTEDLEVF